MAAFPNNPTNGQQATVNGITYTYTVPPGVWAVTTTAPSGNATVSQLNATTIVASGNIAGSNVIATTRAGIGTATPVAGYPLTAFDSINGGIVIQNSTNFTGIAQNGGDVYFDIGRGGSAGTLFFRNSSVLTEQMRLNSAGNLGVGTNPTVSIDAGSRTDAIRIPNGTTAQRPVAPANGMIRYNTTNNWTEEYRNGVWIPLSSVYSATGGTITTYSSGGTNYQVHTFTTSGTFTVASGTNTVEYLIVAGGGGGGSGDGGGGMGGGGAGGVLSGNVFTSTGTYSIVVGGGGNPGIYASGGVTNGGNSSAFSLTAIGGGAGNSSFSAGTGAGSNGGSGGGGSGNAGNPGGNGGNGTAGQGTAGGAGGNSSSGAGYKGGGGGGATQAGESVASANARGATLGCNGGNGVSNSIRTGSPQNYAGGGGAGVIWSGWAVAMTGGTGGTGGGGNGGSHTTTPGSSTVGTPGTANTGGGGGGGAYQVNGGAGGSGIVIIRYVI